MDPIEKKIQALKHFQNNAEKIVLNEIKQKERQIVWKVTLGQMWGKGEDGLGRQIGRYTARTIEIKQAKGQRTDHMTLRDTEDYHKSGRIEIQGDRFSVVFDDWKSEKLRDDYGEAVESPSDETLQTVIDQFLKKRLETEIRKNL